jgi:hypothetical protein
MKRALVERCKVRLAPHPSCNHRTFPGQPAIVALWTSGGRGRRYGLRGLNQERGTRLHRCESQQPPMADYTLENRIGPGSPCSNRLRRSLPICVRFEVGPNETECSDESASLEPVQYIASGPGSRRPGVGRALLDQSAEIRESGKAGERV